MLLEFKLKKYIPKCWSPNYSNANISILVKMQFLFISLTRSTTRASDATCDPPTWALDNWTTDGDVGRGRATEQIRSDL